MKIPNDPLPSAHSNPDPLTDAPGAQPVSTGLGAAAAGAAGAALGSLVGPAGAIAGAVIGAVAGGLGGKAAGNAIDAEAEEKYWRENFRPAPDAAEPRTYEDYASAYRVGYVGHQEGASFEEREAVLRREYERIAAVAEASTPGTMQHAMSTRPLQWSEARDPARQAYDRIAARAGTPGDRARS